LEAEQARQSIDERSLPGPGISGFHQKIEARGDRGDAANAETPRAGRHGVLIAAPDQDRARLRIDRDVEAVFRAVVDDDVELERRGDLAPGRRDDEHRWHLEAL